MERWRRRWPSFKNKFLYQTKRLFLSITSGFTYRHKGNERDGLVKLYEDMETCREYEDIQVMWEMIHSSSSPTVSKNKSKERYFYWRFCGRPT